MEAPLFLQSSCSDDKFCKTAKIDIQCKDSNSDNKKLHITLTEESDPSFFYSLTLTEEDFKRLKAEQNLLVDFAHFPSMLTELIKKCVGNDGNAANFSLVLDTGDSSSGLGSSLNFVERNQFKQLCHLALKVVRGSDARVKEHLAECLKRQRSQFESSRQSMQSQLSSLQQENDRLKDELRVKSEDLTRLKSSSSDLSTQFEAKLAVQVAKERAEAEKKLQDTKDKFESERMLWTDNNSKSQRKLENRVATLEVENRDLLDVKHRNKTQIERLNDQQAILKEELRVVRNELETRKKDSREFDRRERDREKALRELQTQSQMLEQERYRLQNDLSTKIQLLDSANEQKKRLEKQLEEKTQLVAKREESCKKVAQELHLALKTISKFKEQNILEHKQVKASSKVIEEQESLIKSKDEEINELRTTLKKAEDELQVLKLNRNDLSQEEAKLRSTVEELEKRLKTNEQVIHWLNKQLSTAQARDPSLRLTTLPPEGISFTPSNMAAVSTPKSNVIGGGTKSKKSVTIVTRPNSKGVGQRTDEAKENAGFSGLDERYLTNNPNRAQVVKTANGGLVRQMSPPVANLPSNVLKKSTTAPSTIGLNDLTDFPRT